VFLFISIECVCVCVCVCVRACVCACAHVCVRAQVVSCYMLQPHTYSSACAPNQQVRFIHTRMCLGMNAAMCIDLMKACIRSMMLSFIPVYIRANQHASR